MARSAASPVSETNIPSEPLAAARERWRDGFLKVRGETERRAAHLSTEDQIVQSMADASPTKWHRAHVTWFFETFLLKPHLPGYTIFDERFPFLFNSYYVAAGPRHARPKRGLITRPNAAEVADYRARVDAAVETLIGEAKSAAWPEIARILEIGLNHEEQHQELMLTDILHAFAQNPTNPAYDANWQAPKSNPKDGYSQEKIKSMYGPSEIDIKLATYIPVHITYQTAFVEDGKLETRADVYGHDANMIATLKGEKRAIADQPVEKSQPNYSHPPADLPPGVNGAYSQNNNGGGGNFFEMLFGGGNRQPEPVASNRGRQQRQAVNRPVNRDIFSW